jgi:hypothetical protein
MREYAHPLAVSVQDLLRKTSVISSIKVKGQRGQRAQGSEAGTHFARFASQLFFSLPTFFPQQEKFGNATQPGEKGPMPGSTTYLRLPTGRWMNFLAMDHEPTPYSDARVCAPCNLIKAHAFLSSNVRDTSTFTAFFSPDLALLARNALSYTHTLTIMRYLLLQRKNHDRAHP